MAKQFDRTFSVDYGGKGPAIVSDTDALRISRLRKTIYNTGLSFESEVVPYRQQVKMITLTYRPGEEWSNRDISMFIAAMKAWVRRKGYKLRYCWVMELQQRGAPHYHVLVWLPLGLRVPFVDRRGWWKKGSSNICLARKKTGYLMKYVSKCTDLPPGVKFPKGARIYDVGGLTKEMRRVNRYWKASSALRNLCGAYADFRRVVGGVVDRVSGSFFPSLYRLIGFVGRRPVFRLKTCPRTDPYDLDIVRMCRVQSYVLSSIAPS